MTQYQYYKIYECPQSPTEYGEYIGKTPIIEQAVSVVETAKQKGKSYFIKGVMQDGTEVMIL